jgi:hypothetical protein
MIKAGKFYLHYTYFRQGLGHIGVVFSAFTAVNTFYLVSRDWLFFSSLGYLEIMGIGAGLMVPVVWWLGRFDYKKGLFKKQTALATEENSYNCDMFTPKERNFILPVSLGAADVALKVNRQLAELFKLSPDTFESLDKLQQAKENIEKRIEELS